MSTRSVCAVLLLMSLGLWLGGCKAKGGMAMMGKPIPTEGQVKGHDPALKVGTWLIKSQAAFDALGAQGLSSKLTPDFEVDSVVIAAMGERKSGGFWCNIDGVQSVGSTLYVQVTRNQPAEGQAAAQQMTYVYSAVMIPKVAEGTELVAENRSSTGQSP